MKYALLGAAILLEVLATTSLKLSEGLTKLWPSIGVLIGYGLAFFFLSKALQYFQVGVAYAIWSGVGMAIIAIIGMIVFHQKLSLVAIMSIGIIIIGVIGLNIGESA